MSRRQAVPRPAPEGQMITRRNLLAGFAAPRQQRPNIILLVADDLRADALHGYGNRITRTPNLDRLSRDGVTFTRASCAHPLCHPSRAEIMTGCTGFRNGAHAGGRIRTDVPRFAATLRDAGYRTWYSGKWHNNGRPKDHGYERSSGAYFGGGGKWAKPEKDWKGREITGYKGWIFESEDGKPQPELGVGLTPEISKLIADSAIRVIEQRDNAPYFLHVNFTAPHDPLIMPPGYERMYDPAKIPLPRNFLPEHPFDHGNFRGRDETLWTWPRTEGAVRDELACYYAVLSHLDEQIGRVTGAIDKSGQAANTIVMFTADNGMAIGSHGLRGKQNMYEHSINVPLIIRGPGVARGFRTRAQCYLRDLLPTACELAGIAAPRGIESESLVPILSRRKGSIREETFGYYQDSQRMIRTDRWKFAWYPKVKREQLFDLEKDPHELRDLSNESRHDALKTELRGRLIKWLTDHRDPAVQSRR